LKQTWRNALHNPLVLTFYLPAFVISFGAGVLIPVLPLYAGSFDIGYGLVGLVLAGEGLGMLLGDIPAGILSQRLSRKNAMLIGLGLYVLSMATLFGAGSVLAALLCRLAAGFGGALWNVSRHAYIAEVIAVSGRGRAISVLGGMLRLGGFVGPVVGGAIAGQYGLRTPFLFFGCAGALAVILVAAFVHAGKAASQNASAAPRAVGRHLLSTLKAHYGVLASAGAGQLFAQTIRAGRGVIIPLYAADVIGLDVQAIGLIVSIAAAIDVSLFYPAGLIMDRLGRKFAIVPSFLIQALGMFFVPLTGDFTSLLLAASLIGLGNGLGAGSMMTLGADFAPQESRAEFLGMWRLIGDAGSSGGPIAVGSVADLVALPTAAWMMCAVGVMAAAIFILLVPETLHKRQARPVSADPGAARRCEEVR
jgi:MFS family permease